MDPSRLLKCSLFSRVYPLEGVVRRASRCHSWPLGAWHGCEPDPQNHPICSPLASLSEFCALTPLISSGISLPWLRPHPFVHLSFFFFCFSNFSYCPRTWPSLIRAKFWLLRPITLFKWMLILKPSLLMFSPILANFRPVHSFFLFFF